MTPGKIRSSIVLRARISWIQTWTFHAYKENPYPQAYTYTTAPLNSRPSHEVPNGKLGDLGRPIRATGP